MYSVIGTKKEHLLFEDEGGWGKALEFSALLCPRSVLSNPDGGASCVRGDSMP